MSIVKTKREIETVEKKQKIVDTAVQLFLEYGYEKTTITDISNKTEISVGSIYNFFGNKAGILSDIIKEIYYNSVINNLENVNNIDKYKENLMSYFIEIGEKLELLGRELVKHGMEANSQEYNAGGQQLYWDFSIQPIIDIISNAKESGKLCLSETAEKIAEQIQMEFMGIILVWVFFPLHESLKEAMVYNMENVLDKLLQ